MINKILTMLFFLLLCCINFFLVPLTSAFAGGWQGETKIVLYLIEGSETGDRYYVTFADGFNNPDNCPQNVNSNRIYGDTQKGKYLISSIMAAKSTNATVIPLLHGCDDLGRPVVGGIMVK